MPTERFSRELKSEILEVKNLQVMTELTISHGRFRATYTETMTLPDKKGTSLVRTFTVERAEADAGQAANDLADQFYQLIEGWRVEDEQRRADDLTKVDTGPVVSPVDPVP